jgi:competence protein ComEA
MKPDRDFYVSKSNRRGVLLLLLVILAIAFLPRIYFRLKGEEKIVVTEELIALNQKMDSERVERTYRNQFKKKSKFRTPASKFDPNDYTVADWMKLGLSQKQADVILKFSKRGLRSSEDVQRIFVISDELYQLIRDSLVFTARSSGSMAINSPAEKKKVSVELNLADKDQLMAISGIGDYISDKILNYRERLGGFAYKEQLLEIKRIDLELFTRIEEQIVVDQLLIQKLNINSAEAEELKNHPYISWNVANSIVKIRKQKGTYGKLDDILESALIDRELFEKLKPYLSL